MAIKVRPNLTQDQINLAKAKAKQDTLNEYDTLIGKRSRSFYESRLKAYCETILEKALA